jgi:hypothetical protein
LLFKLVQNLLLTIGERPEAIGLWFLGVEVLVTAAAAPWWGQLMVAAAAAFIIAGCCVDGRRRTMIDRPARAR